MGTQYISTHDISYRGGSLAYELTPD